MRISGFDTSTNLSNVKLPNALKTIETICIDDITTILCTKFNFKMEIRMQKTDKITQQIKKLTIMISIVIIIIFVVRFVVLLAQLVLNVNKLTYLLDTRTINDV